MGTPATPWLAIWATLLMTPGVLAPAFAAGNPDAAGNETVEQILDEPLPEEAYADPKRCLFLNQYDSVRVLNEQLVVFEGRRGRYWLNQLRSRCLGLRPSGVMKFSLRNAQVCELDTFRGIASDFSVGMMDTGNCMLGRFEPISKPQLDLLESALRMRRSSPAVDRTQQAEKKASEDASKG